MLNKLINKLRTPKEPEDHGWDKWTKVFPELSWRQIEKLAEECYTESRTDDLLVLRRALNKRCTFAVLKNTKIGKILYD